MDPRQARCRPAPVSRPAVLPLFAPVEWPSPNQPLLPWASPPDVVDATTFVPVELRRVARELASGLIETLASRRPLHQLEPWLSADVLTVVERLRADLSSRQVRLKSLRIQHPRPEVLEVALHLHQADRSRAAAMRLTTRGGRWQITGLVIALDPSQVHDAGSLRQRAG